MIELLHIDCMEYMRTMPDNSVDAIVTDPPYFKVKGEAWDHQWDKPHQFLEWIGELSEQWQRILRPNGSLYCFASPQLRARVEVKIAERFNCLPTITWVKNDGNVENSGGKWRQAEKEAMRSYFPRTEAIIFAEQFGADNIAKGEAGYEAKCDNLRGFVFEPIRAYIAGEWERAGLTPKDANKATGSQMASHYLSRVQWALPTEEKYHQLREYANRNGSEYLRTQYEELRRPFNVTADVPYTDVWTFRTVQAYDGKHVCEKPLALMEHIILASTKPGQMVFDPFMGSGTTGVACVLNDRSFIGCEMDANWYSYASKRIRKHQALPRLFAPDPPQSTQLQIEPAA